jgi:O-acetylserine/cysteine efflux transporter
MESRHVLLMRRYEAGTVAMYALLVPPFGMVSAALVLGERITAVEILAAVLIISGVALGSVRRAARHRHPPSSSPAVEQPALTR